MSTCDRYRPDRGAYSRWLRLNGYGPSRRLEPRQILCDLILRQWQRTSLTSISASRFGRSHWEGWAPVCWARLLCGWTHFKVDELGRGESRSACFGGAAPPFANASLPFAGDPPTSAGNPPRLDIGPPAFEAGAMWKRNGLKALTALRRPLPTARRPLPSARCALAMPTAPRRSSGSQRSTRVLSVA